jgi:TRAP-type C4-dicarboxylate transport system permease small subunit
MEQLVETPQPTAKESSFDRVILQISRTMAGVGAVMFAAMMLVTVIDVTGRELATRFDFIKPINGAVELIGFMLVLGGTWGMGYCQLLRMHIRINILVEKWSRRAQAFFWAVTCLVSLAASVLIAWRALVKMLDYFNSTLGATSSILGAPLWPFIAMMAIGFIWISFILAVDFIKSARGAFTK